MSRIGVPRTETGVQYCLYLYLGSGNSNVDQWAVGSGSGKLGARKPRSKDDGVLSVSLRGLADSAGRDGSKVRSSQ